MDPLDHPGAHQIPGIDVEKRGGLKSIVCDITSNSGSDALPEATNISSPFGLSDEHNIPPPPPPPPPPLRFKGKLAYWNAKVEGLAGLEARGIRRVLTEEKRDGGRSDYLQMFALWFSMNLAATSIIAGLLGPLVFQLGWVDCVCIVIFANALSSCGPSYSATFGPQSGNRTMVRVRAGCLPWTCWACHGFLTLSHCPIWL